MPDVMHSASGFDRIEVVTGIKRRRRWSLGEKLKAVEETHSSGMSVSYVARKYGISPSLLFRWRKLITEEARKLPVVMTRSARSRSAGVKKAHSLPALLSTFSRKMGLLFCGYYTSMDVERLPGRENFGLGIFILTNKDGYSSS